MYPTIDDTDALLIPDTSVLLDIVRSPVPSEKGNSDVRAVFHLIEAVEANTSLTIGLLDLVSEEYERNIDGVATHARNDLRSLEKGLKQAAFVDSHMASPRLKTFRAGWPESLIEATIELAGVLFLAAEAIATTVTDTEDALERLRVGRAPARRGSASLVDSIITVAALRVAGDREPGTTFFLTTNFRDFCDEGRVLKADLEEDFAEKGLVFTAS